MGTLVNGAGADRWQYLAILGVLAALVAGGLLAGGVWLVGTADIPPWLHAAVEFLGWWLVGGLTMAFAWAVVLRYDRSRRARHAE